MPAYVSTFCAMAPPSSFATSSTPGYLVCFQSLLFTIALVLEELEPLNFEILEGKSWKLVFEMWASPAYYSTVHYLWRRDSAKEVHQKPRGILLAHWLLQVPVCYLSHTVKGYLPRQWCCHGSGTGTFLSIKTTICLSLLPFCLSWH